MPRLRKGNRFQGKAFYYLRFAAGKEVKVTRHEKSFRLRIGKHLEICSGRFLQFRRLQLKNIQLRFLRFRRIQLRYSQLQHIQLRTSQLYTRYSRLSYRRLRYLKCLRFRRLRMRRLRFRYLQARYWRLEHFFSDYKPFRFGHLDFLSKKWQSLGVRHFRPVDYSLSQFKGYPQDSVRRTVLRERYIRFVPNSYLGILLKSGNTSSVNISAGKVHIFPFLRDWQGVRFR